MFGITTIILGLGLLGPAAGAPAIESVPSAVLAVAADTITGTVASVDIDAKSFSIKALEETKALTWNDETIFLLDGEESDAAGVLVEEATVVATIGEEGVATSVSRTSE